MRKKIEVMMAAFAAACVCSTWANPVDIKRYGGYFTLPGGEFTIEGSVWATQPPYVASTIVGPNNGFQSFCLERGEGLHDDRYWAVVNLNAMYGGEGPAGDRISVGTAWLYHQFATGVLLGYDYDHLAGRSASAKDLQETIWWLEGELLAMPVNPFSALVTWQFANPQADYDPNDPSAAGFNNVRVLNMYALNASKDGPDYSERKQDMLVLVPDGGLTLVLLGSGLLGLAVWRRKV